MKRFSLLLLLLCAALILSGCFQRQPTVEESLDRLFGDVDPEQYERGRNAYNQYQADHNGDTYCKRCDKFIPGKVRICPYCGQYI
jgi:outer membrane lipoprotein-sorting protein